MKKRFILNDKSNKPARKKIKVSVKDEGILLKDYISFKTGTKSIF